MKNKTITYVLIVVVVIVWGGIFIRIFASVFSGDASIQPRPVTVKTEDVQNYEAEANYTIKANYRDPFFSERRSSGVSTFTEGNTTVKKIKKKAELVAKTDWSFIKYIGLIKNSKSEKKIALVRVNNQDFMISEGEVIADLKCLKNYRDSILISYQGKRACIRR